MRILETPWDTLVLDRPTATLILDFGENLTTVRKTLGNLEDTFVTVKSNQWSFALAQTLMDEGFFQVETMHTLRYDVRNSRNGARTGVKVSVATRLETEAVVKEIENGRFATDRFSLNPAIETTAARLRYRNWMEAETNRGASVYLVTAKNKKIGFFCFRDKNCEPTVSLSGTFASSPPMSGSMLHQGIIWLYDSKGYKQVYSHVSSNNLNALWVHSRIGYSVVDVQWVFQSCFS